MWVIGLNLGLKGGGGGGSAPRPPNLLSDPNDLTGPAWSSNGINFSGNTITADGTNSTHRVRQDITTSLATNYVLEADVENIDATAICLVLTNSSFAGNFTVIVVDPSTWTISQSQAGVGAVDWGDPDPERSVTALGGGVYRLRLAARATGTKAFTNAAVTLLPQTTANNFDAGTSTGYPQTTATGSATVSEMYLYEEPA